MKQRTADPYRDLDVIDARAPRFLQASIGVLALVAFLTGWWPLLAILAAQLVVGLVFGRRYCLPCLAYFELVQPRFGEGPIEDSRPPRFSNMVGAVVLTAATISLAAGLDRSRLVARTSRRGARARRVDDGCLRRLRGVQARRPLARRAARRLGRIDFVDFGDFGADRPEEVVVQFSHPLCTDCRELEGRFRAEGRQVVTVDVSKSPELARRYGVVVVPTAFAVGADGTVAHRLAG